MDKKALNDAVAKMFRSFGVDSVQFANEKGQVEHEIKSAPKKKRLAPLKGYGDTVKRGDRVLVWYNREHLENDGKPVTIQDYSLDENDPWMVAHTEEGRISSFNYTGGDFRRTFKKVK